MVRPGHISNASSKLTDADSVLTTKQLNGGNMFKPAAWCKATTVYRGVEQ